MAFNTITGSHNNEYSQTAVNSNFESVSSILKQNSNNEKMCDTRTSDLDILFNQLDIDKLVQPKNPLKRSRNIFEQSWLNNESVNNNSENVSSILKQNSNNEKMCDTDASDLSIRLKLLDEDSCNTFEQSWLSKDKDVNKSYREIKEMMDEAFKDLDFFSNL